MSGMNFLDIIILLIFFFSIIAGFARGFISEMISLATWILAVIIASMFASPLAEYFTSSPSVQSTVSQASNAIGVNAAQPVSYFALGISFALLFFGTIIVGSIVSYVMNLMVQSGILGLGNRLLGAIFGLCRGFIINLVLIFLLQLTPIAAQAWWQQSQLVGQFQPAVAWLGNIVSPGIASLKDRLGGTMQDVNSSLQNMTNSVTRFTR